MTIATMLCFYGQLVAQENKLTKEKWKEFEVQKIVYFTRELDLTTEETGVFWRIYDEMQGNIKELEMVMKKKFKTMRETSNLTEEDYKSAVETRLRCLNEICQIKSKYYKEMLEVLPASKVFKIEEVEHKFYRQLFNKFRQGSPKK